MLKYLLEISSSNLFCYLGTDEIVAMLKCLAAYSEKYEPGDYIYKQIEEINEIGLVLSGSAKIIRKDFWCKEQVIEELLPGDTFLEEYACVKNHPVDYDVVAVEKTEIMFIKIERILSVCHNSCLAHKQVLINLMGTVADKAVISSRRLNHLTIGNTRRKILAYLSDRLKLQKNNKKVGKLNKTRLAKYLAVDRCSVSKEIARMHKEGILAYNEKDFHIISEERSLD